MLYIKNELRKSKICGLGLFTLEKIKKGRIIGNFSHNANVMTEEEYQKEQGIGNSLIIQSAVRWAGKLFVYNSEIGNEDYINHSDDPNILYHCGLCFALKDIDAGEELTINYRYFLAENDVGAFMDAFTGEKIDGLSSKESLLRSSQELIKLLYEIKKVE